MPEAANTAHCSRISRRRIAPAASYRSAWLAKAAAPSCVPSAARRVRGRRSGSVSRWLGIVAIGDGRGVIEDAHAVSIDADIAIHRALGNRVCLTGDLPDMGLTIGFAGLTGRVASRDRRLPLAALFLDGAIDGRLLAIGYGSAVATSGDVRGRQKGDEQQNATRHGDGTSPAHNRMALARARR